MLEVSAQVPVVWVQVEEKVARSPETVRVEAKRELVVVDLEISSTLPEIAGVVTAL